MVNTYLFVAAVAASMGAGIVGPKLGTFAALLAGYYGYIHADEYGLNAWVGAAIGVALAVALQVTVQTIVQATVQEAKNRRSN